MPTSTTGTSAGLSLTPKEDEKKAAFLARFMRANKESEFTTQENKLALANKRWEEDQEKQKEKEAKAKAREEARAKARQEALDEAEARARAKAKRERDKRNAAT